MSQTETEGIVIEVVPRYLPEASRPGEGHWLFAYDIRIENRGERSVQLLNRHWIITDGEGQVQEVRGAGVVGEQPVIEPGAEYRYSSGCPLTTPVGAMQGRYEMQPLDGGERFWAEITPFRLAVPHILH